VLVLYLNRFFSDRVNHKPIFKNKLRNQTATLGQNLAFNVEILSDFHHTVSWTRQKCINETECPKKKIEVKGMFKGLLHDL
jgi:hypothetical protein